MKKEDAVIGEKYRMLRDEKLYGNSVLTAGAVVLLKLVARYGDGVLVQDLSESKYQDGLWATYLDNLAPIEEPSSYAAEALKHYTEKEKAGVNAHYDTTHQPIEVMQANMTRDELIGFLKGNIIKYACRCGRKDDPKKEAAKIKQYADWLCAVLNGETIDPRV